MINGGNNSTAFTFDPISRITAEVNPLCPSSTQFGYTYVDQTPSDKGTLGLSQVAYPNGQSSNFNYFSTTFDERLQEIQNLNSSSNVLSQFDHAFDRSGQMTNFCASVLALSSALPHFQKLTASSKLSSQL